MSAGPRRKLSCLLCGLAGLAFGILGAESTFGRLRTAPEAAPLLFSLEVRDEAGALLASPLLVGEQGRRLHLDLSQAASPHSEPMQMSLDLDPRGSGANLCVEYSLSFDGERARRGRMSIEMGRRRSVRVPGPGEPLRLDLVVARAGSPEFEKLLLERRLGKPLT